MRNPAIPARWFATAALLGLSLATLRADIIYDNSVNDLQRRFDPGVLEVGDEILLSGTARYLTDFSFEFWALNSANPRAFSGSPEARIRFYVNDGPAYHGYRTPGTTFYDSGWFSLVVPTPRSTFEFTVGADFPSGGLFMPVGSSMTWSVQFQGLGTTDTAGVDLFSPPVVGGSFPDYWENSGTWQLKTNSLSAMDFAARFQASPTFVPEPGIIALLITGLAAGFAFLRRRD